MTLHWWMHWFWVTTLLFLYACSGSLAAPQSEELQHITTDYGVDHRQTERQSRAMYYTKTVIVTPATNISEATTDDPQTTAPTNITNANVSVNVTDEIAAPTIQWTPVNATDLDTAPVQNDTKINVTVKVPETNVTQTLNATFAGRRNVTVPDYVKDDTNVEVSENRIVTEKPLSLETAYQTRLPPNIESSRRVIDIDEGGMDTGAIAGISFGALVLAALAGSTAFVLYRRRYLNKPQTLNDKCSNPDSSGYLDDSTVRDNSEEMYSLDNDSFLNSLEAMTIQNYWTDTVKHTKL